MRTLQLSSRASRCWFAPVARRLAPVTPIIGFLVFACADPPTAPHERDTTAAPPPSLSQGPDSVSAATHTTNFFWTSGQGPVPMGSITGRVCFLTRVAGMFGSARYVRIYSSGGSWWLTGYPVGVSAQARCQSAYSYTGEYSWSQGQNPTQMGYIYGRSCFLTRVGGDLEGSGERVEVFSGTTAYWFLGGSSLHSGVHARARCVVYAPWFPKQPYYYTSWVNSGSPAQILKSTSWSCYLAGVRGDFEGMSAYAHVFASGGSWYVKANSQVFATGAKAGCTLL
jgi:hypothetical protein